MNQIILLWIVLCVCVSYVINQKSSDLSDAVICSKCVCEKGTINCRDADIHTPFSEDHWLSVSSLNPVIVNYSHNPLKSLPAFPSLPIQTLDLTYCDLETLSPAGLQRLEDLVVLDLSHNKLTTINVQAFMGPFDGVLPKQFTNIRRISLAHNDICSLEKNVFVFMKELNTLDLSDNPLAFIDQVTMAALSDLSNLKELRFRGCQLESLPEGLLRRHRDLRTLDLSDNRFKTIPDVLSEADKLIYLNLDNNPLVTVESSNALKDLTSLEELHLNRLSKLTTVKSGAIGMVKLRVLHMSHNPRFSSLHPDFLVHGSHNGESGRPRLKELYLNNNNLSSIDSHILGRWDQTIVDVSHNPYNCDCNIQWMVHTLVPILNKTIVKESQSYLVCMCPPELTGLPFRYLYETKKALVCPKENLIDATAAEGIIVLGVVMGVIMTFPLVFLIVVLWKRGFFKKCRRKINDGSLSHDEEVEYL